MRIIILDGLKMTTHDSAYKEMKDKLDIPRHYGENCHALTDAMSEPFSEDVHIIFTEYLAVFNALGEEAVDIIRSFYAAYSYYPGERIYKFTVLDGPLSSLTELMSLVVNK